MLQLFADIDPNGTSEAYTPIRWCVTPALNRLIEAHQIANPYLLIVIRPYTTRDVDGREVKEYGQETQRYFVPLTAELTYVSFSRSGSNSAFATVVWEPSGGGAWSLKRAFRPGTGPGDLGYIFDYSEELNPERYFSRDIGHAHYEGRLLYEVTDEITVTVPKEMFAPEPTQWRKDYVGKFFQYRAFDQCHFRKRFWPLFVFGIVYFPFAYLARVVQVLIGLVLGLRDVRVRSFGHPLQHSIVDVLENAENPRWWYDKDGRTLPAWRWPFNPVTVVALALIIFFISGINVTRDGQAAELIGWGWWQSLGVSALAHLVPFALWGIVMLVALVVGVVGKIPVPRKRSKPAKSRSVKRRVTKHERREAQLKADIAATRRELEQMVCTQASTKVAVEALPKEKRTFRLHYQATKSKVCRPFVR